MPPTWLCPSCGRRVPAPLGECRCGALRSAAVVQAARMQGRSQKLPRDVVALLVVLVLLVVGGLVALFLPYGRGKSIRLLGTLDRPRPAAIATPASPARR
jgi:hypothetical protein